MPHLSPSNNRGRSPSSNGCTTTGNGSERAHQLLHLHSVASANNTGADLNLIYNVKPRSTTTNQDGGRSLPRPARKNYHQQRSPAASSGVGAGTTNGTISGWRSRSSEAANGGRSQQFMSRSYAAPTISSRTHHQQMQQQQQRQRGQLSRSHEERALRSISVGRQSLTASKNGLNNQSIQQQQQQQPQQPQNPPPSYSSNPVIQSTLSNSITSSSGSRNALAASITQQVMK